MAHDEKSATSTTKRALLAIERLRARVAELERARTEPIAVVGMACRFPGGVETPEQLWQLLRAGKHGIVEVPPERWDNRHYYHPGADKPGRISSRFGGFLTGSPADFDAAFFGITPAEARCIDPQQRLLLEVAWEALEHAGLAADRLRNSATGVFVGLSSFDYALLTGADDVGPHWAAGNAHSVAAGRISYTLGLQGPSMAIDTACSSSLVATHLACRSLRHGDCDTALVGGVNLLLGPTVSIALSRGGFLADDGQCKTFDADADGYVRSEGAAMLVLQRLSDARALGQRVWAVIRGSAVNQDGPSSGLTVPNGPAQEAVIRAALRDAGMAPERVDFVETHGTGTPLGDPIEVAALGAVYGASRAPDRPLVIGSIKTNIGHTESAAGMAGLLKVVLALHRGELPANRNFRRSNPELRLEDHRIAVATTHAPWPARAEPRVAAVSSFGFSGTNAHVVVEQAPASDGSCGRSRGRPSETAERPWYPLCLSARDPAALSVLAERYAQELERAHNPATIADICFTASTGRQHFGHRLAVVCPVGRPGQTPGQTPGQKTVGATAAAALRAYAAGEKPRDLVSGTCQPGAAPPLVFMFSGQGAQYPAMTRELYHSAPSYRDALDECAELLADELEEPLLALLFSDGGGQSLGDTANTQPALFAVEYALVQFWRSLGVTPAAVIGHSSGEYAAACAAGIMSLADAVRLVAARGRLMASLPRTGEMAAVFGPAEAVADALDAELSGQVVIAAANGPLNTVISGQREAVRELMMKLKRTGVGAFRLPVSHAAHSPLMSSIVDELRRAADRVSFAQPRIDYVGCVRGALARPGEVTQASYWAQHLSATVRFAAGIKALHDRGYRHFVEIAPDAVLTSAGMACLPEVDGWYPTLRRARGDWRQIMDSIAGLYVAGIDIDWSAVTGQPGRRKVVLPTYPFQRQRYWLARASERPGDRATGRTNGRTEAAHANDPAGAPETVGATDAAPTYVDIDVADRDRVLAYLRQQVTAVTELPASALDEQQDLPSLGVDSIMIMSVIRSCERDLGIAVQPRDVFARPCLDHLCALLRGNASTTGASSDQFLRELDADLLDDIDISSYLAAGHPPPSQAAPSRPERVFLTGATGFVGAYLVAHLLDAGRPRIHCLVRCPSADHGMRRIRDNLQQYGIWRSGFEERISVIPGDLAEDRFGLPPAAYEQLSQTTDQIIHCAAQVNWVYPYSSLRPSNVHGALNIIRLAAHGSAKPVHHISTMGVYPVAHPELAGVHEFLEDDPFVHARRLDVGYFQSKLVAERVMHLARARGLHVSMYRASLINGDSRRGVFTVGAGNVYADLLVGCMRLGWAPATDLVVNVVPVDIFARAVVHNASRGPSMESAAGRSYTLLNRDVSLDEVWDMVNRLGSHLGYRAPTIISFAEWMQRADELPPGAGHPLQTMLPVLQVHSLRDFEHRPLRDIVGHDNGDALLAAAELALPSPEELTRVYFDYFRSQGYF